MQYFCLYRAVMKASVRSFSLLFLLKLFVGRELQTNHRPDIKGADDMQYCMPGACLASSSCTSAFHLAGCSGQLAASLAVRIERPPPKNLMMHDDVPEMESFPAIHHIIAFSHATKPRHVAPPTARQPIECIAEYNNRSTEPITT